MIRIMAVQEEGSECCMGYASSIESGNEKITEYQNEYPEYRDFWLESTKRNYNPAYYDDY